ILQKIWSSTWDLRTAKLAVAVAIIKSKPPGVSGRQHAEILAARLKKQEETWKAKAEDLKEEVLQLRQELLLTKLLSKPRKSAEAERGECVCVSPSHFLTNYILHSCHALSKRMQFLQHLSGLRRWSGPALVVDGDGAVVWDSVLYLLSSVIEAFKQASGNKALPDPPLLLQASRAAAQALEQGRPSAQHLGQMEDLLKELLDLLLSNSELNKFAVQKTLTECLISLGGSSTFRSVLVRLLLSHINHLAGHLWTSCQVRPQPSAEGESMWSSFHVLIIYNKVQLFIFVCKFLLALRSTVLQLGSTTLWAGELLVCSTPSHYTSFYKTDFFFFWPAT
uniref:Meiosis-specific, MEI4 homolog (S. cerevisiae) n=1 Tax=Astyanax mexicanus TaxID=7994 RepID=A0A8B9RJV5_ASTMX